MELLNKIVSEHSIIAFGITVMKSLWIGAIVSVLAAILFSFTRKSAHARYIIAALALATIFISTVIVFVSTSNGSHPAYGYNPLISDAGGVQQTSEYLHPGRLSEGFNVRTLIRELSAGAERLFIDHSEWIVLLWLIGVVILGVKFTGGYIYASRFSTRSTTDLPAIWAARIGKIAGKINLQKKIRTVKSLKVKVPMVTGWLRPVLILPASLLSGIPADQLEAIIAHELAHIKRNDYLVNIIQSLVEIIMFYNPAIWWLSKILRRERENCCDDIALEAGTKSVVYAKALASMQAISLSPPSPAVAIKRNNNHLINRIKRITAMKRNNNNTKEKLIALSSVAIMLSALIALTGSGIKTDSLTRQIAGNDFAVSTPADGKSIIEYPGSSDMTQDTVRKQQSHTVITTWTDPADNKEKEVNMRINEGQLIELIIDGEIIPQEDYPLYQDLIDDTMADYEKAMKELEDLDMEEIERDIEEAMRGIENIDIKEIERDIKEAMAEMEDFDVEEINRDIKEAMRNIENIDIQEIEMEIEEAIAEMEDFDMEEINRDIKEAMKDIENIDIRELEIEIEEAMAEMEDFDLEEITRDTQEALREIENIDIEELKIKVDSIRNNTIRIKRDRKQE
jgi:beta-lactamase regulating signal transducer with metallopeptidase domain